MTKVVGARSVTKSLPKTGSLPDSTEHRANALAFIEFRSGCREEVNSARIDFGNACIVDPEESEKVLQYRNLAITTTFRAKDGDGSA